MDVKVRVVKEFGKVLKACDRANDWSLRRAGAYIRGVAMRGIKTSPVPAPPGSRPHTRKGRLRRSIIFAVEQKGVNVLIGPAIGAIGKVGATHEFGLTESAKKQETKGEGAWMSAVRRNAFKAIPIRIGEGGKVFFAKAAPGKYLTGRQLRRSGQIVRQMDAAEAAAIGYRRGQAGPRKYPKRAFMRPTLDLVTPSLPDFWYQSVRG